MTLVMAQVYSSVPGRSEPARDCTRASCPSFYCLHLCLSLCFRWRKTYLVCQHVQVLGLFPYRYMKSSHHWCQVLCLISQTVRWSIADWGCLCFPGKNGSRSSEGILCAAKIFTLIEESLRIQEATCFGTVKPFLNFYAGTIFYSFWTWFCS